MLTVPVARTGFRRRRSGQQRSLQSFRHVRASTQCVPSIWPPTPSGNARGFRAASRKCGRARQPKPWSRFPSADGTTGPCCSGPWRRRRENPQRLPAPFAGPGQQRGASAPTMAWERHIGPENAEPLRAPRWAGVPRSAACRAASRAAYRTTSQPAVRTRQLQVSHHPTRLPASRRRQPCRHDPADTASHSTPDVDFPTNPRPPSRHDAPQKTPGSCGLCWEGVIAPRGLLRAHLWTLLRNGNSGKPFSTSLLPDLSRGLCWWIFLVQSQLAFLVRCSQKSPR